MKKKIMIILTLMMFVMGTLDMKPLADLILKKIQEFREKGRRSDLFNHLSAVR